MKRTISDGYNQAIQDYKTNQNIDELYIDFAYKLKGFWYYNKKTKEKDYKVIETKYDKGYWQALEDLKGGIKNDE